MNYEDPGHFSFRAAYSTQSMRAKPVSTLIPKSPLRLTLLLKARTNSVQCGAKSLAPRPNGSGQVCMRSRCGTIGRRAGVVACLPISEYSLVRI